jgi:hypothetical protein
MSADVRVTRFPVFEAWLALATNQSAQITPRRSASWKTAAKRG